MHLRGFPVDIDQLIIGRLWKRLLPSRLPRDPPIHLAQLWVAHLTSKNVVSQFWDLVFNYIFFNQFANSLLIYFMVQNEIFLVSLELEICKTCKAIFCFLFMKRIIESISAVFLKLPLIWLSFCNFYLIQLFRSRS